MLPRITDRKLEVLILLTEGDNNSEIASKLRLTPHVIKNYVRELYNITGMANRVELALWFLSCEKEIAERYNKEHRS